MTGQLRPLGHPEPERTAALLVHTAEAQLHRVLLDQDDADVLTRALLALADLS
ncbi:MAG TPA: hypothetical protein VHH15_21720 [Actinophytocola sp.]|nr:hypothetical protein [Actinophytocola sp.]